MGEGVTEAKVIRWLVKQGDFVKYDQPLVEIATDKVDSEVPSPFEGVLKKIIAPVGAIPKVGETIAIIAVDENETIAFDAPLDLVTTDSSAFNGNGINKEYKAIKQLAREEIVTQTVDYPKVFISPYVELLLSKLKISRAELLNYVGTDRIPAKKDVMELLAKKEYNLDNGLQKNEIKQIEISETSSVVMEKPEIKTTPDGELVPMNRMRKIIAEHMSLSSKIIPHVTSFIEADVTKLLMWRNAVKADFQKQHGVKLTMTPLFIKAIVSALKAYPEVNVSIDEQEENIIMKRNINIGMATVLADKNLIVPVIKNADQLSLQGLTMQVHDLSLRARQNELKPHEITGGTFTFTNIGMFGSLTGTPIINHPEAAILAIGAVNQKPAVVDTEHGKTIGIRDIVMLSIAYDHRVIDGGLGGMFLKHVAEWLTNFDESLL